MDRGINSNRSRNRRRRMEFSTSNEGVRIIPQVVAENPPDASWPRAVDHSYRSDMKRNRPANSAGEVHSYVQLQHEIHDALRQQHPEWIERNGDCPTCDSGPVPPRRTARHFSIARTQVGCLMISAADHDPVRRIDLSLAQVRRPLSLRSSARQTKPCH